MSQPLAPNPKKTPESLRESTNNRNNSRDYEYEPARRTYTTKPSTPQQISSRNEPQGDIKYNRAERLRQDSIKQRAQLASRNDSSAGKSTSNNEKSYSRGRR